MTILYKNGEEVVTGDIVKWSMSRDVYMLMESIDEGDSHWRVLVLFDDQGVTLNKYSREVEPREITAHCVKIGKMPDLDKFFRSLKK